MNRDRLREAKSAIKTCVGYRGFYAGDEYRQYWVRDLGYSVDTLLELGYANLVKKNLMEVLRRQDSSGNIPTVIHTPEGVWKGATSLALLRPLTYRGLKNMFDNLSFLNNVHGWTSDNAVIYLDSIKKYEDFTEDRTFSKSYSVELDKIFDSIDRTKCTGGMIRGSGWTDGMTVYNNKFTLLNQVWLYKLYNDFDMHDKAHHAKKCIDKFWDGERGYYVDYLGGKHFDTLANAFILEEGLVKGDTERGMLDMLKKVRTEHGYLNLHPTYSMFKCTQYPNVYQNSAIWPFIEYRVARAFDKLGLTDDVKDIKSLMEKRRGFNEWYSLSGKPDGSKNQLWTSCAYVGVYDILQDKYNIKGGRKL